MINEVIISKLDELIGDFDTPFFNYLIYSYDLTLNDCELIISNLKNDIAGNNVSVENIAATLEDYFKSWVVERQKEDKIEFLADLIRKDSEFFIKYLKKYDLSDKEIDVIFEKVKSMILSDDISDFEIKRYLEYYFANAVKQVSYIRDLDFIVGRNYDTLIIKSVKKQYPILLEKDIVGIVKDIHAEIIEAKEFPKGIRHEFKDKAMKRSEAKKADARKRLQNLVEGKGDSFNKLIRIKNLTKSDGKIIVSGMYEDINAGRIQPGGVDNLFIVKRFDEYIENERE